MRLFNIILVFILCAITFSNAQDVDSTLVLEEQPYPQGGLANFYKKLGKKIKYPKSARRNNIEGRVLVQFIVRKEGRLSNFKILESLDPDCDREAIEALKALEIPWVPGKFKGKSVHVRMAIPIQFKLSGGYEDESFEEKMIFALNLSGNHDGFFESGISTLGFLKDSEGQMTTGFSLGNEYNFEHQVFAPKLGISAQITTFNKFPIGFNIGVQNLLHTQKKNFDYVLRPEIGIGHKWVFANYGYNFFLSDKTQFVSRHVFSLNLIVPLFAIAI